MNFPISLLFDPYIKYIDKLQSVLQIQLILCNQKLYLSSSEKLFLTSVTALYDIQIQLGHSRV